MQDNVRKISQMIRLINDNPRITVRRIRQETGIPRSTAYRWLESLAGEYPIKIVNGIVFHEPSEK